jgi:hypothetical protein
MAPTKRRRREAESGAVLVEAAFALPVFLLLIFGVIEWGLFFAGSATTTSATREGARYASANFAVAATQPTAADQIRDLVVQDMTALTGQDVPVSLWIYKANASGYPGPDSQTDYSSCNQSCYRYSWTGGTFVRDTSNPTQNYTTPDACGVTLDSIGVYVQVKHAYVTGILTSIVGATSTISEATVSRLEPKPNKDCPSGST